MPTSSVLRGGLTLLILGLLSTSLSAQQSGRIVGRIVDAEQGAPIAGARVDLVEDSVHTVSALDGRYTLPGVPAGTVSVRVRMIGFGPKVVTGVVVTAGQTTAQDISMAAEAVRLAEISVSAASERGTVNRALEEQRSAVNIVNAVSAEQIAKSPDSDAGQAIQRVSGVTVQDGKYIFVRGLGERYTTTTLNGSRIPSPEPERKVVPLDLFPSGLLEGITTSKTFTPDQSGDFSGAEVNLKTREFPANPVLTFSASGGFNTAATGRNVVKAPTVGPEWLGFAGGDRKIRKRELEATIRRMHLPHLASAGQSAARDNHELAEAFTFKPSSDTYAAFRTAAGGMLGAAEEHKELLVKRGMSVKVLDDLRQSLGEFDAAVELGNTGRAAHLEASAELRILGNEIVRRVRLLDAVNQLAFRNDRSVLAAWAAVSRVQAAPKSGAEAPESGQEGEAPAGRSGDVRPAA